MQIALHWFFAGLLALWLSSGILMISFTYLNADLKARIYPRGNTQELATICQVTEEINAMTPKTDKFDGYFWGKTTDNRLDAVIIAKEKVNCIIIEERKDEYKVAWDKYHDMGGRESRAGVYKWVSKKDFHKYHDLSHTSKEELKKILK